MAINLIGAVGENNEVAVHGNFLWRRQEIFDFFDVITRGKRVAITEDLFNSDSRFFKNRNNLIIFNSDGFTVGGCRDVDTVNDLVIFKDEKDDIFVAGGASLYLEAIKYAKRIYLTELDIYCPSADEFFPEFDKDDYNATILKRVDNVTRHLCYERKSKRKF